MVVRNQIKKVKVHEALTLGRSFMDYTEGFYKYASGKKRMGKISDSPVGGKDNNIHYGKGQRTPCLVCIGLHRE